MSLFRPIFVLLLGIYSFSLFGQTFYKDSFIKRFNAADFKAKVKLAADLSSDHLAEVYPQIKDSLLSIKKRVYYKTNSNEAKYLFDLIDARNENNNNQYHKSVFLLENSLRFHTKTFEDSLNIFAILKPAYLKLRNLNKAFGIEQVLEVNRPRIPKERLTEFETYKSIIYLKLGLYKESVKQLRKEFNDKDDNTRKDTNALANFYNNTGVHFNKAGIIDSAVYFFNKAKPLVEAKLKSSVDKTYYNFFLALIDGNIAYALTRQKLYKEAIPSLKKDIYWSLVAKNLESAMNSYNLIVDCYLETKQFDLAKRYLDTCRNLVQTISDVGPTLSNLFIEAKYYKYTGNLSKAIELYDKYISFKDSLAQIDNETQLINQQVAFDLYQKENLLLEKEKIIENNKLSSEHSKSQRAYLILGMVALVFVILFLGISVRMNKSRQHDLFIKNKHIAQQKNVIEAALKEKEFLMKEIHHRVKNNLQIVSSMLSLQADKISNNDVKEILQEGRQRINSMALIHQLLYNQNNMSYISISNYLQTLVGQIETSFNSNSSKIKVSVSCDDIKLDLDSAIPLGLIVNELITNSFKHAFKKNPDGVIEVSLTKKDKSFTLLVKDNGEGFDYESKKEQSLGMELINILVQQINGEIKFTNQNGTSAQVIFSA